jgi:hypothetical protein
MHPFLVAAAALTVATAAGGGAERNAGLEAPVPEPVKRAIVARFADTQPFYFPASLPPGYRYSHWDRGERERSAGERSLDLFSIYYTSPQQSWIEAMRENGRWARWRQARPLAPCRDVYGGGRRERISGRRVFYVGGRRRGTAAFCERGYAVELTLNQGGLRPPVAMRLVARAELVER